MDSGKERMPSDFGRREVIKTLLFLTIFVVLLLNVSRIMTIDTGNYEYHMIRSVYEEPPGTLDGIYIGSSNCFTYWNSLAAFQEYGIAVLPFASNSQPLTAAEHLIREARKTQPDALYIVNINTANEEGNGDAAMHWILDYMPFSLGKLRLTDFLVKSSGVSGKDAAEYYFPLIRYHSRWDELQPAHFRDLHVDYKNSFADDVYFYREEDVTGQYTITAETSEISEYLETSIVSLLDYCDAEQVNILFVTVPQAKPADVVSKYNRIGEMITARGYRILDLLANIGETNIQTRTDFYNEGHTNIHGSLKFTHFLSDYLIQTYGFADKRQDPAYAPWLEATAAYGKRVSRAILDFELQQDSRDYSLEAAAGLTVQLNDGRPALSWNAVQNADGYAVYRKSDNGWELLQKTGQCAFEDPDTAPGLTYQYNVVAYTHSQDGIRYGNFSYAGVTAET